MYTEEPTVGFLRQKDIQKALKDRLAEEEKRNLGERTRPIGNDKTLALVILIGTALINTFVLGIVDVVAISGFIGDTGILNLPWLWSAELVLNLFISATVMQLIDKVSRIKMIRVLVFVLFLTYSLLTVFFLMELSTKILYPFMYLIYAQQGILFPMALWNLANQVYTPSEAKKYFPVLSSGDLLGRLLGYSLFTLTGLLGHAALSDALIENPSMLMLLSAGLFGIGVLVYARFPRLQTSFPVQEESTWVENIKSSYETIHEVPFFRYVALLVSVTWIALTLLLYNFYTTLDTASAEGLQFQTIYSAYNISVLLLPLLFQWTIGDELLERISPKNGYFFLPVTILIGVGLAFLLPGLWGGISALFISIIVYRGWYMPLYQSLYALVQAEHRGRVRSLLGSYSYVMGSLIAALFIGGTRLLLTTLGIGTETAHVINLVAALLAAIGAIYIASRIRLTYEDSLLSWRVARRKRSSAALDKLDS
jgi:AAA family ATP:ADP antiporter